MQYIKWFKNQCKVNLKLPESIGKFSGTVDDRVALSSNFLYLYYIHTNFIYLQYL
jgi:hypothetical protein